MSYTHFVAKVSNRFGGYVAWKLNASDVITFDLVLKHPHLVMRANPDFNGNAGKAIRFVIPKRNFANAVP